MSRNRDSKLVAALWNIGFGLFIALYLLGVGVTLGWITAAVFGVVLLLGVSARFQIRKFQYGDLWVLRSSR